MQHDLPALVTLAVIRGLTHEQSDRYYRGYYPQQRRRNHRARQEQIALTIGAVTVYQ